MSAPESSAPVAAPLPAWLRWGVFGTVLLGFILVPFLLFEDQMNDVVQQTLRSDRSIVLITLAVVLFLLADIVLPIPSSFVLASTGYLLCFIGMTCAALGGYALGRYAGGPLAQRIVGEAELGQFSALSQRWGDSLLVACRAMPVLAEATTILAGTSRMPLPRFIVIVSIGNAVVSVLYAWIGAVSASQSSFVLVSLAAVIVPLVVVLVLRRLARASAAASS
jgi:membrane protein DedA with SNARE-associated domain